MHVSDSPNINYLKRPPSSGKEDKKMKGLGSPDKMNQGFPGEVGAKTQLVGHLKRQADVKEADIRIRKSKGTLRVIWRGSKNT